MKTHYHSLILAAVFAAATFCPQAQAVGGIVSGTPHQAADSHDRGHLVYLCHKYVYACAQLRRMQQWVDTSTTDKGKAECEAWRDEARKACEESRADIVARMESHPHEINAVQTDHDWYTSPLCSAIQVDDVELVRLMLAKGAIPFLTYADTDFLGPDGDTLVTPSRVGRDCDWQIKETSREIRDLLRKARSEYNVLEVMLQAQAAGINLKEKAHQRPTKQTTIQP